MEPSPARNTRSQSVNLMDGSTITPKRRPGKSKPNNLRKSTNRQTSPLQRKLVFTTNEQSGDNLLTLEKISTPVVGESLSCDERALTATCLSKHDNGDIVTSTPYVNGDVRLNNTGDKSNTNNTNNTVVIPLQTNLQFSFDNSNTTFETALNRSEVSFTTNMSKQTEDMRDNGQVQSQEGSVNATVGDGTEEDLRGSEELRDRHLGEEQPEMKTAAEVTNSDLKMMLEALGNSMKTLKTDILKEVRDEIAQVGPTIKLELEQKISQLDTRIDTTQQDAEKVKQQQTTDVKKISKLEAKVKFYETKFEKLQNVLSFQEQVIKGIIDKVEREEEQKRRNKLFVKGLTGITDNNGVEKVNEFFKNTLLITHDIPLLKAYRKTETDEWVTVLLKNNGDRFKIFENASNLKGKKNINGQYFKIRDNQPPRFREERRRRKEVIKQNNKASVAEQIKLSVKKNKLIVTNQGEDNEYTPPLHCPSRLEAACLTAAELLELNRINLVQGPTVPEKGNTFTGLVMDAGSIEEVNKAYLLLRYKNMNANHIICACRVPGDTLVNREQFMDDEDYGMGRVLWEYMKDVAQTSRAIFIIRTTDGTHLNAGRFDAMIQAAKQAVNLKPLNTVLDKYQFSWPSRGARGGMHGVKSGTRKHLYNRVEEKYAISAEESDTGSEYEGGRPLTEETAMKTLQSNMDSETEITFQVPQGTHAQAAEVQA